MARHVPRVTREAGWDKAKKEDRGRVRTGASVPAAKVAITCNTKNRSRRWIQALRY